MAQRDHELDEDPSPEDVEVFGDVTVKCPKCGSVLYDDAELCWKCGHALSSADKGLPTWALWVAGGMLMLFVLGMLWRVM